VILASISSGLSVAMAFREIVLSSERCRALVRSFAEQPRVFNRDARFAGQDAQKLQVAFVKTTRSWSE